jgi:PilZ domain
MLARVPTRFTGAGVDLRRAKRYPMIAAVTFCWHPGDGVLHEGHGLSVDISSGGVFVVTDSVPRIGAQLEIDIYLRPTGQESEFVRLHGEGKVVRTDKKDSQVGFAAEVLFRSEGTDSPLTEFERARLHRREE